LCKGKCDEGMKCMEIKTTKCIMAKYLGPGKSVLEFMQRKKVVGGPVPFGEYYQENIINPRNKL
jgi:hypothetical protein